MGKFFSTKKFGPISTSHRQWRAQNHCSFGHGYSRYIQFVFGCTDLDDKMWVQDFGGLKDVRQWIELQWDHRLLLASDDPLLPQFSELHNLGGVNINVMDVTKGWGPGIEASARHIYDHVQPYIHQNSEGRVWIESVEIWEHENNSAIYHVGKPLSRPSKEESENGAKIHRVK
jgi:6-pyruvoyltetrahydropterin/6-carboxytetrahydropterin synthase